MTHADAKAKIELALDTLIEQLELGRSEALTTYPTTMSRFHQPSDEGTVAFRRLGESSRRQQAADSNPSSFSL